jgi:hypothetical protein
MLPAKIVRVVLGLALLGVFGVLVLFWEAYIHEHAAVSGDVTNLKDTDIVLVPDAPLVPDKNVMWCGTTSLAWNEAIKKMGGELHFQDPFPEAELLNRQVFTKADLDEGSYVVVADTEDHNVAEQIRDAIKSKFGESVTPRSLPDDSKRDPQRFTAYVCLNKDLEFPNPFNTNAPLLFEDRSVANFGFGRDPNKNENDNISTQVSVLSYVSDDNFVIRLKTKEDDEQVILAKIAPSKTLQATIDSVLPRIDSNSSWGVNPQDDLAIPKIDFDLTKTFTELEGRRLISGMRMDNITEGILFQLNEAGVKLTAFTTISVELAYDEHPPTPRHFIFDKPFLLLLKRSSSPRPYFALWVGNPTLLVAP